MKLVSIVSSGKKVGSGHLGRTLKLVDYFKNQNVELRPVWKPMHMQPYYHKEEFVFYNESPVSNYLFEHGLCLPSGINLKEEDQKKIIKMLLNLV